MVRGLVLSERERAYVEAAKSVGATSRRCVWRHALPNVVPPAIVLAMLKVSQLIRAIAELTILGLGAQPPTRSGALLNQGRPFVQIAPQLMIYPGLALSLVALGFNLLGDGLRHVLNPRLIRITGPS